MATQICHLTQFFQERNLLSHNLSFKISPYRIKTRETLNLILYKKFLIGNPKKQLGDLYFTFISSNIFYQIMQYWSNGTCVYTDNVQDFCKKNWQISLFKILSPKNESHLCDNYNSVCIIRNIK